MRRRDILQHIGGSMVAFSVATSKVSANEGDRRSDALEYVSSKYNVAKENLEVLNDSVASWSTLGESYYQAKIHDSSNKRMYRVLLDENNESVNRQELHDREEEKYQSLYGKYSQQFNNKISNANQDDTFEVNVRLKSEVVDRQDIGRKAKENTNDDTKTNRKLREELKRRRINKIEDATKELADRISNLSSTNIKQRGTATARITMESSKKDLERVAEYQEVSRIVERSPHPQAIGQDSATRTINAADSDGPIYDINQAPVGILENNHPSNFVEANIADTRWVTDDQGRHVTEVTECAASTDDSLPGTAHEADVYSADGAHDEEANLDNYIDWFASNGVVAFNTSYLICTCGSRTITNTGIDYEESCFNQNLTHVQCAGNEYDGCECGNLNVRGPARTFNSIAVGNIYDQNTPADRSDDTINNTSCYINPESRNASDRRYPHQKPEVAAVGTSIDTPYNTFEDDDNLAERTEISQYEEPLRSPSGTSYSAPNVAGMLAILEDQYGGLANAPDTAKAVSMASANHDVESYSRDRIGAGCIDVDEALSTLFNNNFITDTFDENNNSQDYSIELEQGDTVDIVLVWRSDMTQQDWSNRSDLQSDINLELNFYDPDYNLIAYDGEYDRAWQFIEGDTESITIDQTGSHRIKVWNSRWEADSSLRHFTLAWRTY